MRSHALIARSGGGSDDAQGQRPRTCHSEEPKATKNLAVTNRFRARFFAALRMTWQGFFGILFRRRDMLTRRVLQVVSGLMLVTSLAVAARKPKSEDGPAAQL